MLVNQRILDSLIQDAGEERTKKAKIYQEQGRVQITNQEYQDSHNFEISAFVIGTKSYKTYVAIHEGEVEDIHCSCQDYQNRYGVCKHTLALVFQFSNMNTKQIQEKRNQPVNSLENKNKYRSFHQIVNTFYNEEIDGINQEEDIEIKNKGSIKIEPKIIYDKFSADLRIEFKIGFKKMYKIKDLSEFYTRMLDKEFYRYGEKLQFIHTKEMFEENSQTLLDFIMRYAEVIKYANSNANSNYRYYGKTLSNTSIMLGNSGLDELFDILIEKKVLIQREYQTQEIEFTNEQPRIEFKLKKIAEDEFSILPNIEIFQVALLKGKQYRYILDDKKLYRCTKEFENSNLKLLELFRQNYLTEVKLGRKELPQFFSIIAPKVKNAIILDGISKEEVEEYRPKELGVKVYLDFDRNDFLIADIKFCYEEEEFNPLDEKLKLNFPRNMIQEAKALNIFRKSGFMFDTKHIRFILPDNDKIYNFLTEDISFYMQRFEVLVTEKFKTKQIKQPKMGSVGVKVENNLLKVDLKQLEINIEELEEIMTKYSLKKKYHRLKDGSFIELENNKEIDFLDKLVTGMSVDYEKMQNGEVILPVYRSLYMNQLLKGIKGTEVVKNTKYKQIVNRLDKEKLEEELAVPENLNSILRYYQKTGFQWLKTLDKYKFGGILADDMGLRKNNSNALRHRRLCSKLHGRSN